MTPCHIHDSADIQRQDKTDVLGLFGAKLHPVPANPYGNYERLCLGGSSGTNVAGVRLGKMMGSGHTVVTILCDSGTRCRSRLFNPAHLRDKGLTVSDWLE